MLPQARGHQLQVLLAFAGAVRQCGKNEVWTECTGCELQCGQDENVWRTLFWRINCFANNEGVLANPIH
uniref:Secreted protein n=1 Tax=Parascaris equorum TaxID=6256 RepID=A0A914RWY4_PAREQ